MIEARTDIKTVAAIVSSAFADVDAEVVLSGGAVVSIYSDNQFESYDLDFIGAVSDGLAEKVLTPLGFKREGRHFKHHSSPYWIEIPASVLKIGSLEISSTGTLETDSGSIRLLTPTQCVMDRLAAWFHWNDSESLEQALAVARCQPIDLAEIHAWAGQEGQLEAFERFRRRLH